MAPPARILAPWIAVAAAVAIPAPAARADEGAIRSTLPRHRVGVQVGGSGPLLFTYRGRIAGPVHIEAGFFAAPPWLMGSVGALAETRAGRWSLYAGAGAGGIAAFDEYPCEAGDPPDCTDRSDWRYLHARAGVTLEVRGPTESDRSSHRIGADIGLWRGITRHHGAGRVHDRYRFLIPMAGLSYAVGF